MKIKRLSVLLLLLLVMASWLVTPAFAADDTGSLKLHFVLDEASFRLYHIADYDSQGGFKLRAPYYELPIDWSYMESFDWYELANDLDTSVLAGNIPADRTVTTDKSGTALAESLPYGLWLITGETFKRDRTTYTTQPMLIAIPGTKDGQVIKDREITITKFTTETKPDPLEIRVVKIWEDSNSTTRPKFVLVTLYCDGKEYETVKLNDENNWRYVWPDLEPDHAYRVGEPKVPDGYKVSYGREGNIYLITNTKHSPPPPTPPYLPQTGVNWTPVIILLPLSLICLIIGVLLRRRSED